MHIRGISVGFFLSILFTVTPFAAGMSCEDIAGGGFSAKTFQRKLNTAFHQTVSPQEALAISLVYKIRPFRPFKVVEVSEFFPNGELPSLVGISDVRVIRADRETGLRELRKSVTMNEERGWIFVPSMNLWIYNSVLNADARNTNGNALLCKTLIHFLGEIETYHNHPNLASKINYDEYQLSNTGLSLEQYHVGIAIPTTPDLMGLTNYIDLRKKQSLSSVTGHVVSEFGVTSYRMRAFPYHNGKRDTGIYPAITVSSYLGVLKERLPANLAIRKTLLLAAESSTAEVSCMEDKDICHWTPHTAPKLLFEFKPW